MSSWRFGNNSVTTLSAAITSTSATTLTVTSASTFPPIAYGQQLAIAIDSEIMWVVGISSNTFSVMRGQEGTTAATHANGAGVYGILTAGGVYSFLPLTGGNMQGNLGISSATYPSSENFVDSSGLYSPLGSIFLDTIGTVYYPGGPTLVDSSGNIYSFNGDVIISSAGQVTLVDGINLVIGASSGSSLGQASSLISVYGVTPVAAQTAPAAVATTSATNVAPYGFTTAAQANAIITTLNSLRTALINFGIIK